jgi:hypothetical protein
LSLDSLFALNLRGCKELHYIQSEPVLTASWRGRCKHAARCVISA